MSDDVLHSEISQQWQPLINELEIPLLRNP